MPLSKKSLVYCSQENANFESVETYSISKRFVNELCIIYFMCTYFSGIHILAELAPNQVCWFMNNYANMFYNYEI